MKKTTVVIALLAAVVLAAGSLSAQEVGAPAVAGEVTVPVKPYKALAPPAVYRAALEGITADVRFEDAFSARAPVPAGYAQVVVNGYTYGIVTAFTTDGNLLCLVPGTSSEALAALFGIPSNAPLTPQILAQPMVLNEGQKLVVEGTILGEVAGNKAVVVDAAIIGEDPRPRPFYGLQVIWPGAETPVFITNPGDHDLVVPSTANPGQNVSAQVRVTEMTIKQLMADLAQRAAQREGLPGAVKTYGEYSAGNVYRHAGQNDAIAVDFTDRINQVIGFSVPQEIATVPAARGGVAVDLPVGYAFTTMAGTTCVVGADQPVLVARAASALPGEQLRIRGTVVGRAGAYAVVLADYIGFPEQEALTGNNRVWMAVLTWPGTYPRAFWAPGTYVLVDLPSPNAPGRFERLQVTLGEYRRVQVPGPAGAATE